MADKQFLNIKPAEGKQVRDQHTMRLLRADGERKPRNSYWLRRLKAGDVVEVAEKDAARAGKLAPAVKETSQ